MSNNYYGTDGLIGLDVKPRKRCRSKRNRYTNTSRWLLPAIIAIITLGIFMLAGSPIRW